MLAGQYDSAVDLAEVIVVFRPRRFAPITGASQSKGHAMPRHSNAILIGEGKGKDEGYDQ